MKIEKNFTTGILSGICGALLLLILTGVTTKETTNVAPIYEFYDLKTTKGVVFNKVTGEINYEEIREEGDLKDHDLLNVRMSNWNGLSPQGGGSGKVRFFD